MTRPSIGLFSKLIVISWVHKRYQLTQLLIELKNLIVIDLIIDWPNYS